MSSITKLNWNELDGTVADVNDIKPIADKVDDAIDVLNPLDDEVIAARDGEASLLDKINSIDVSSEVETARGSFSSLDGRLADMESDISDNDDDIAELYAAVKTQVNYQGEWDDSDPNKQATLGEMWKYNNKFWVCMVSSTTTDPSAPSSDWGLWDNISEYVLDEPTVTTSNINENSSGTHTISNYDSNATYSVSSSDSLISSISVSGNTISISTGDITDNQDHTATYTVTVSKDGYLLSQAVISFTVVYVQIVSDDALLWEGSTYIEDNFDEVEGGAVA